MIEKCYSTNDEIYQYSDEHEAVADLLDVLEEGELVEGLEFYIHQGDIIKPKASKYCPQYMSDQLGEIACDEDAPEGTEWPETSRVQEAELQEEIKKAIDEWADRNNLHPDFNLVENTKKLHFVVTKIPTKEGFSAYDIEYKAKY